ncbi:MULTISPECIES: prepilin peptidase [unclassified Ruegeria]|uniref:prepilin peptidase n=1 Tax=unclassified Ruegeria TaxID=2625375 RepID=UPI001ADAFD72|nr:MULTISPECIES: prepilin peptidase [unclassified Ruegeria]MBO9410040.1 prepilin peptidase [Ruegeria sp. R8_1]MBO9414741.1 prepilin peptidase [Ruegeria sp. R8_2]
MQIPAAAAGWFLPFVLPICFYVAFTDMRDMLIKNHAVVALAMVFVIVGLIVVPPWGTEWSEGWIGPFAVTLPPYLWQLLHILVALVIGILANAAGVMGAGDAKFIAAASAFVWGGDYVTMLFILMSTTLAAFVTHRLAKNTALRAIAPNWESWSRDKQFPMGFALGGSLAIYLILGTVYGS